jgi:hypothetical protein
MLPLRVVGFNPSVPAYLSLPVAQGGVGLTHSHVDVVIVMQAGMWFGLYHLRFRMT